LYAGSLAKAQADFKQATEINAKDVYAALWLDIAERRNNLPSRLSQAKSQIDVKAWPGLLVQLMSGELNQAQVLEASEHKDPDTKRSRVCEVNFYSGELALLKGAKQDATRMFQLALNDCPRDYLEWSAAQAELKALGAK
jgi:lipoprotein NlpI